jgi:hypothetical protein
LGFFKGRSGQPSQPCGPGSVWFYGFELHDGRFSTEGSSPTVFGEGMTKTTFAVSFPTHRRAAVSFREQTTYSDGTECPTLTANGPVPIVPLPRQ